MVPVTPISYPCYKPILLNMAADQRIKLALHCPTIQKTDKRIPLKIKKLTLNPLEFRVDGTTFDIDFYRHSHIHKISRLLSSQFERIRFPQSTTLSASSQEKFLTSMLEAIESRVVTNEDGFQDPGHIQAVQRLSDKVLTVRTDLGMIRPLDHTDYLNCTLWNGRFEKVECLEYTRSAWAAMAHMLLKIFGTRELIYVDGMRIGLPEQRREKIRDKTASLRIPPLFQFLDPFNFKITRLLSDGEHVQVDSPLLQKAEILSVCGNVNAEDMGQLQFKNAHFLNNIEQFLIRILQWIEEKPMDIGTLWVCDFDEKDHGAVLNFFDDLSIPGFVDHEGIQIYKNDVTRLTRFPNRVVYQPVDKTSEMHVFCKEFRRRNWMMVMEVMPIGS